MPASSFNFVTSWDVPSRATAQTRRTSAMPMLAIATLVALSLAPLLYGDQLAQLVDVSLAQAQRDHLGLPMTILFFTVASFIGAPQPLLVGAAVLAFGPERGFAYAMVATVCAGATNYYAGHISHAEARRRFCASAKARRLMRFIGDNALLSSFLVRFVPSAPFVVVNMAFGVARANFWGFLGGIAVGSMPKTAVVAFGLDVVVKALHGEIGVAAIAGVACVAVWMLLLVVVRRWYAAREAGFGGVTNAVEVQTAPHLKSHQ